MSSRNWTLNSQIYKKYFVFAANFWYFVFYTMDVLRKIGLFGHTNGGEDMSKMSPIQPLTFSEQT